MKDSLEKDIFEENAKCKTYEDYCAYRIVGGIEAPITTVPYQVALRKGVYGDFYWATFCGGSLVTLKFVLSATHCFEIPGFSEWRKSVRVVAGTTLTNVDLFTHIGEQSRKARNFYVHKNYNTATWENDIGVIELETKFIESSTVKPIRMHMPGMDLDLRTGVNCLVSGFGLVENDRPSRTLRMVCVPLVSSSLCSYIYGRNIFSSMLCAGGHSKDSCTGDSGGPLVCRGVLVGIVSWGGVCGAHPGAYTRVSSFTGRLRVPFVAKHAVKIAPAIHIIFTDFIVIVVYYIAM